MLTFIFIFYTSIFSFNYSGFMESLKPEEDVITTADGLVLYADLFEKDKKK